MKEKVDFSKLSNSEINLKILGYENEYNIKKDKILKMIGELQELDSLYIEANNELKKRGVAHIYVMCTYALFTEGIEKFNNYYQEGKFDGIYTTNLSYIPEEYKDAEWLHAVDSSKQVAQVIRNLHNNESISPLLRDKSYIGKVLTKKFDTRK